jgi:hypothetical protein
LILVFIHFGHPPSHLSANIVDVCTRFPHLKVVLISDFSLPGMDSLQNYSEKYFNVADYMNFFGSRSTLPVGFRGGFWLLSLIRLIVLADFVESEDSKVLHIESDVVLSSDFPFDYFYTLGQQVAFVRVSNTEAIASILYIPSSESALKLKSNIYTEFESDPALTDMSFLSGYSHKFPEEVFELPASVDDTHTTDFIFDGSDYGQYLFGTDPRNSRGVKLLNFENPNTRISTGRLSYNFNRSREFIDISDGSVSKRLVNLHIHSKNMRLFQPRNRKFEFDLACARPRNREIKVFMPRVFIAQFYLAIRRRIVRWFKYE